MASRADELLRRLAALIDDQRVTTFPLLGLTERAFLRASHLVMSTAGYPSEITIDPWNAAPPQAVVRVPGSKSLTNRALVVAALADGPSILRGALDCEDTQVMVAALRAAWH